VIMDINEIIDFWVDYIDDIYDDIESMYGYEVRNHIGTQSDIVRDQSSPVYHNILNNVQQ